MAFWGVEIKPGKPFTHSCENARGRLRISRATLGFGEALKKSGEAANKIIVQCNVGNRRPVLLCVLLSGKKESCQLDLEFEEADDVVFSIIGPRSVYLTGYYVQRNHRSNSHSDTESYGVDIENTQTDGSSYHSDDDVYEDSFINDDDEIKASQQSPVLSNKGMDEVTLENEKSKERKGNGRQHKKKYQVIESDSDANSHENEDKDVSLSVFKGKGTLKTTTPDAGEKTAEVTKEMDDEAKDDGLCNTESKQNDDPLDINSKLDGEKKPSLDEEKTEVNEEMKVLSEKEKTLEKNTVSIQDTVHENNPKETSMNKNVPVSDGKDQSQSLDPAKLKKKRKGHSSKEEKTSKVQPEIEASTILGLGENCLGTSPESGSENSEKSVKRRKEHPLDGSLTEGIDEKCQDIHNEDISGSVLKDLEAVNGESEAAQWGMDEVTLENEKSKERKGRGGQLKKKYQVIESDSDANSHENEDKDGSFSVFNTKGASKTTTPDTGEKIAQITEEMDDEAKDDGLCDTESMQNDDPLDTNSKLEGEKNPSLEEEKTEVNEEMNVLPKEEETLEKNELQSLDLAKPKKKRKKHSSKEEKTSKVQAGNEEHSVLREDKEHEIEASTILGLGENCSVANPELGSENSEKSVKRRKELPLDGSLTKGIDEKCHDIPKEDISGSVIKDLEAANGESEAAQWGRLRLLSHFCGEYEDQQRLRETSAERIRAEHHTMPRDDEFMQEPHADVMTEDMIVANAENQEQQIDNHITTKSELLPNDQQPEKKIKKKRKKTKTTPMKYEDQSTKMTALQKWTLPSGLIIEELASGPLNGKVAALGKRVKIHYSGTLKESGHVFQGKASVKFRLGDDEFIDGLNRGIEGMRVGDERRLIVPPSMGFGDEEVNDVPPNSWLIYDIELVGVFK